MLWNIITIVLNFWRETFPRHSFRLKLGMPNQVAKSLKNVDSVLKKSLKIKLEKKWEPFQATNCVIFFYQKLLNLKRRAFYGMGFYFCRLTRIGGTSSQTQKRESVSPELLTPWIYQKFSNMKSRKRNKSLQL